MRSLEVQVQTMLSSSRVVRRKVCQEAANGRGFCPGTARYPLQCCPPLYKGIFLSTSKNLNQLNKWNVLVVEDKQMFYIWTPIVEREEGVPITQDYRVLDADQAVSVKHSSQPHTVQQGSFCNFEPQAKTVILGSSKEYPGWLRSILSYILSHLGSRRLPISLTLISRAVGLCGIFSVKLEIETTDLHTTVPGIAVTYPWWVLWNHTNGPRPNQITQV